ncbi:13810_t:CDS:2, partial [Gigaspora margarita]
AQLRYAFSLLKQKKSEKDKKEFIKYLTQAADNGNLYLNGKVGFQIDEEKGKKYLILAAKKGHSDTIVL